MEKVFLIVVKIDGVNYITLTKEEESTQYALRAYKTQAEALDSFDSFRRMAKSSSYESFVSGSMGILGVQPHIIAVASDDPESLKKYIVDMRPLDVKGSTFGAFVNFVGVKVNKEIYELSVCDVAKNIIDDVYGKV